MQQAAGSGQLAAGVITLQRSHERRIFLPAMPRVVHCRLPAAGCRLLCVVSLLLCALASGACAKARAEAAPDGPPLEMPAPPPRVLAPVDQPLPATAAIPEAEPPIQDPRPPARQPLRRTNGTPADAETRPEPPAPVPAAAAPPTPEPVPTETRELRAAPSSATAPSSAAAAERTVRDLLVRAARDLNRVDYGRLSADGRTQYEQSKRFSQQAEQALKDRNFVFATTLADKAATLATELLGGR